MIVTDLVSLVIDRVVLAQRYYEYIYLSGCGHVPQLRAGTLPLPSSRATSRGSRARRRINF